MTVTIRPRSGAAEATLPSRSRDPPGRGSRRLAVDGQDNEHEQDRQDRLDQHRAERVEPDRGGRAEAVGAQAHPAAVIAC